MYININKILLKLLIKYIINLRHVFKNKILKKEASLIIKRVK